MNGYRHKLRERLEGLHWAGRNVGMRVLNPRQVTRLVVELEDIARSAAEAARLREALTDIARQPHTPETGHVLDLLHLDRLETRLKERP